MMTQTHRARRLTSLAAAASALLLVFGSIGVAGMPRASAQVTYKGSGTQADPYLVETVDQLSGIRGNLKAHYRLADTIDLSGAKGFGPIGWLANPFTGSLTCPTDQDGNPLYAIKNLRQSVASIADTNPMWYDPAQWAKNQGRMEAGLFGATKGATFTNILVLDVQIDNKTPAMNQGLNKGGKYYNPLPADETGSGALVGIAKGTAFSGCAATGKLTGSANYIGGLVGQLTEDSSAENCYANVTLETSGWWGQGGLFGVISSSSANRCWSAGSIKNEASNNGNIVDHIGGFAGSIESAFITNCYTTVKLAPQGYNFSCQTKDSSVTNCYASGTVDKVRSKRPAEYGTGTQKNCFVVDGVKNLQDGFEQISAAGISKALVGKDAWVAGPNGLPALSSVKVPKAASQYVPGKSSGGSATKPGGDPDPAPGPDGDTSEPGEDEVLTDGLTARLASFPDNSSLVTLEDKAGIMQLKIDYDATVEAGIELQPASIQKVTLLYNALSVLMLGDISARLQALPEVDALTAEHKHEILAIQSDYKFISETSQSALVADLKEKLDKAVAKVADLDDTMTVVNEQLTTVDWVIVGVLAFIAAALATGIVWMTVVVIKAKKNQTRQR